MARQTILMTHHRLTENDNIAHFLALADRVDKCEFVVSSILPDTFTKGEHRVAFVLINGDPGGRGGRGTWGQ